MCLCLQKSLGVQAGSAATIGEEGWGGRKGWLARQPQCEPSPAGGRAAERPRSRAWPRSASPARSPCPQPACSSAARLPPLLAGLEAEGGKGWGREGGEGGKG